MAFVDTTGIPITGGSRTPFFYNVVSPVKYYFAESSEGGELLCSGLTEKAGPMADTSRMKAESGPVPTRPG